jgi:CheY-like chemotaxis protein
MRGHDHVVLLVDDDGDTRDAVREHLAAVGMEVFCARHGRAALQLISLGIAPCVIVVDIVKPNVAGTEFRRALQYDATLRDIPVAVIAGGANGHSVRSTDRLLDAVDFDHLRAAASEYCPHEASLRRDATPRSFATALARPARERDAGRRLRGGAFECSH